MTRKQIKGYAKNVLSNVGMKFYLITLLILGLSIFSAIPIIGIIAAIALIPISFSFIRMSLIGIRGEEVKYFETIGLWAYIKSMLWLILYYIIYMIPLIVGFVILEIESYELEPSMFLLIIATLLILLSYILIIYKSLGFAMVGYLAVDNPNATGRNLLKTSLLLMRGHRIEYFILGLSFILWNFLSIFTCGIAYVYVFPYMQLTYAGYYEKLKNGY